MSKKYERRIAKLLEYNNFQVEKRREATALLRECAERLRVHEGRNLGQISAEAPDSPGRLLSVEEAYTDGGLAARVETFLLEIHQ